MSKTYTKTDWMSIPVGHAYLDTNRKCIAYKIDANGGYYKDFGYRQIENGDWFGPVDLGPITMKISKKFCIFDFSNNPNLFNMSQIVITEKVLVESTRETIYPINP